MAEKISINHENQMMIDNTNFEQQKQSIDSSFNSNDYSNSNGRIFRF